MSRSSVNEPEAATNPATLTPIVPLTLRSVEPERPKPKLPPPSTVSVDQSSGVSAVDLLTRTSRFVTKRSTPVTPTSDALATLNSSPVYVAASVETDASVMLTPWALIPVVPSCTVW